MQLLIRSSKSLDSLICSITNGLFSSRPEFLGVTMWAAGYFDTSYALSEVPFPDGTDQLLAKSCTIPKLGR